MTGEPPNTLLPANTISIPTLNVQAPLIYNQATTEDEFQHALQNGVVHYPGTAMPGQAGNAYYFGHSSDYITAPGDYKTVFVHLPKINIDAIIKVTNPDGQEFTYRVIETKVVQPDDLSVLEQDLSVRRLSLQTSYPIGTALRRFIVIAELVE
jgi:sortase A